MKKTDTALLICTSLLALTLQGCDRGKAPPAPKTAAPEAVSFTKAALYPDGVDSFSPIIYRGDTANKASVLLNHKRFTGDGFNLNGLVAKDNYLPVAKMNEGLLFKVPLDKPG